MEPTLLGSAEEIPGLGGRREGFELGDFGLGERAEFAGGDIEGERAELSAFDFFDAKASVMKHAANLAIAALDQDDFVPRIGSVVDKANFGRRSFDAAAIVERDGDAVAQALNRFFVGLAADLNEIGFGYVRSSLGELLGERAVVG